MRLMTGTSPIASMDLSRPIRRLCPPARMAAEYGNLAVASGFMQGAPKGVDVVEAIDSGMHAFEGGRL